MVRRSVSQHTPQMEKDKNDSTPCSLRELVERFVSQPPTPLQYIEHIRFFSLRQESHIHAGLARPMFFLHHGPTTIVRHWRIVHPCLATLPGEVSGLSCPAHVHMR